MLVLSRHIDETIVFPNLGITIQILRLSSNQVRMGINAPPEVSILRGELAPRCSATRAGAPDASHAIRKTAGQIRSHLNESSEVLRRLHEMIESNEWQETESLVFSLFRELKSIDAQVAALLPQSGASDRFVKKQALLVDDNQNETRLLASYLRLKQFDVETANNGADALHYLARNVLPDVMLLDMNMPRFDGRWTVNELRSNPKYDGIKIFAVSGIHPAEYGVEVSRNGVDHWFRKPVNPEELVHEIANALDEKPARSLRSQ